MPPSPDISPVPPEESHWARHLHPHRPHSRTLSSHHRPLHPHRPPTCPIIRDREATLVPIHEASTSYRPLRRDAPVSAIGLPPKNPPFSIRYPIHPIHRHHCPHPHYHPTNIRPHRPHLPLFMVANEAVNHRLPPTVHPYHLLVVVVVVSVA